jgi:queuine tRNA-ribosyltransferase
MLKLTRSSADSQRKNWSPTLPYVNTSFQILQTDPGSQARRGRLMTPHGMVATPVFMPVGTQATVKAMAPDELKALGVSMILANAYHLHVRPGADLIARAGGLHRFMGWRGPILTDSGGFQVFSLATMRTIREDGVEFNSHVDGRRLFLGPREAMSIQKDLGSDIAMVFDECAPFPCNYEYACQAMERTLTWAAVCSQQARGAGRQVFGIVQGGTFGDLRRECAERLAAMGFDGYAIGGVSVGEPEDLMLSSAAAGLAPLPADAPRYLMGVGHMRQIVEAVALGVDMFDCVIPTRVARNGSAVTRTGRYPLKAARYKEDAEPIESGCECYACRNFSRGYVRHLLNTDEILGVRLLTTHNLHCYMDFMRDIQAALETGTFAQFRRTIRETVVKE